MIADVVIEIAALGKGRFERGEGFRRHAVNDLGADVFQVHSRGVVRNGMALALGINEPPLHQRVANPKPED
ncbi:hypothetical protein [Mesorhizobium sp.]|uniref:hypothetical protein n=1 Tax=Mesorhizobium sp. TaxID=1871066 RepID=UPI000FEA8A3D|nr:hypothetical protein [Mesorhizobium sp.]RWF04499.1 MAG: hypothetical protein EOS68_02515 [Mesorhizobium sp.]